MTAQAQDFIHRYIPSVHPNAPTLLMLHGTGGDEDSLLPLGNTLDPQASLLSPRGQVLEGDNPRFFRRHAEGLLDMEDLVIRTHELADWIEAVSAAHHIAPGSVVAVGYSNGANIAASLMLLRPKVLRHAILLRAMLNMQPDPAPDLTGADALLLSGAYDPLEPSGASGQLAAALKSYGADVTLQVMPSNHSLSSADIVAAQAWLQRATIA